jgi:hypothetical protein
LLGGTRAKLLKNILEKLNFLIQEEQTRIATILRHGCRAFCFRAKTREIQESKVGDDAGIINRKNEVGLIINFELWMIYI